MQESKLTENNNKLRKRKKAKPKLEKYFSKQTRYRGKFAQALKDLKDRKYPGIDQIPYLRSRSLIFNKLKYRSSLLNTIATGAILL